MTMCHPRCSCNDRDRISPCDRLALPHDLLPQLGDPPDPVQLSFFETGFFGRGSEIGLISFQRSRHSALGIHDGIVPDGQRLAHPHLAPENDSAADIRGACNADLGGHQAIPADHGIMPDLDQVIHLSAPPDAGIMTYAPVDRTTGPDLHIVLYHHAAAAFHLTIPDFAILTRIIVESIRS